MAMQFNLPPAGTDLRPETALDNLRLGYMVDRFTGAAIDRTIAGQAAHQSTVIGDVNEVHLTIGGVRSIETPGSYHLSDRLITMNTGALLALADGVHISFYNCTFAITEYTSTNPAPHRFAFGILPFATDDSDPNLTRADSARVADGVGNTRSINFYGCTVNVTTQGDRSLLRCQLADSIGSDFRFLGEGASGADLGLLPSPQNGGRWINSTFVAGQQRSGIAFLETYGFPDIFEGVELYGLGMNNGLEATSSGPRMLVEPDFTLLGQTNVFVTQGTAGTSATTGVNFSSEAQIAQNVGFFTPPDNDDNADGDVIGAGAGTEAAYVHIANGGGGAINYAAYQPTYRDAITGAGVQNVKVRVNTSIALNNPNANVASTFQAKLTQPGTTQTVTGNYLGNEYLTNTDGQLTSSRFTRDGWSTSTAGYFDMLEFNARTGTDDIGSNRLAANTLTRTALLPPENTALAVIQDIRGNGTNQNFSRHEAQYQAFSWTHDILQELSETSTTLFDDSTRATSTLYGINRDLSVTAPDLRGSIIKDGVTTSTGTPDLTAIQGFFDQDDVPSINDIRMAWRYERWEYRVLGNPQTTPLNIIVDNGNTQHWSIVRNTNTIDVRGAGLAAKSGEDVFTSDANIATLNMNGHPITGLTLGTRSITGIGTPTTFTNLEHSSTEPAATNCTLIGQYSTNAPSGDVVNITFTGCNLSQLDLFSPSGSTLNVRGTDNEMNPLTADSFNNPAAIRAAGNINFPAPEVALTVQTPDEPGYFGVIEITGTTSSDFSIVRTAMTTGDGTVGTYEIPADNMNTHRFFWKQRNTTATGYATTIIDRSNSGLSMSMTETMEATPYIATLYSGDGSIGRSNTADPVPGTRAADPDNNGMRILVDNQSTDSLTNPGAASQFHILTGMDSERYITTLMNAQDPSLTSAVSDLINPDSLSSTVSNARYIQLSDTNLTTQQQLVGAQFDPDTLEPLLPEDFTREIFPFVTNDSQLTDRDRFYLRDPDGNYVQITDFWPGLAVVGGIQIIGSELVVIDDDRSSMLFQHIQRVIDRGTPLNTVSGRIFITNSAAQTAATYDFDSIARPTEGQLEFSLSTLVGNRANTITASGVASGDIATSLSGNTRTGFQTDQVVTITEMNAGGETFSFPSVILFPNPAGATPAQIEAAASNAVNNSSAIANTRNGVGYLIGTGGDSRLVGIKPRAGNYDPAQRYGENL